MQFQLHQTIFQTLLNVSVHYCRWQHLTGKCLIFFTKIHLVNDSKICFFVRLRQAGKHKTLNVGAPAAKLWCFSFTLVYRTHLGKHKTLNLGAPAAKIQCFQFYACLQDASRQAQNFKCWPAAGAKNCTLGKLLKRFTFKNSPPQAENFGVFEPLSRSEMYFS